MKGAKGLLKTLLVKLGVWFFDTSESLALLLPHPVRPKAKRAISRARSQARKALEKDTLTRVFLENLGYRTTLNAITKGVMFFLTLWLTRVLSPKDFGLYSFTISTAMLFAIFASFGVPRVLTKRVPEFLARGKKEEAGRWVLGGMLVETITALSVFVILFISSQWLAVNVFHKPFTRGAIKLAGGFVFVYAVAGLIDQIFVSLKRNDISLRVGIIREIVKLVAIFLFVYLGFSYIGAVYGYMLGFFAFLLFGLVILIKKYTFLVEASPESPIKVISQSWWFLSLGISGIILSMTDILMISMFLPIQYAGYYKIALSLVNTVMFLIPIGVVTMPLFSESKTIEELNHKFAKILKPTMLLSFAVSLILVISGRIILELLYPHEYVVHAWIALMVLAFMIPLKNIFWLYGQRRVILGQEKKQFLILTSVAILNIILNGTLIPYLGISGAALASVASLITGSAISYLAN